LPAIANRLRLNRGFESAWYSDNNYAALLQKDWALVKNAWSLVTRSSRSRPRLQLTLAQQLQQVQALRQAREAGGKIDAQAVAAAALAAGPAGQTQGLAGADYANLRVGRVFTQHLPYKSIVSTFAYAVPKEGPQAKYGLFPKTGPVAVDKNQRSRDRQDRDKERGRDQEQEPQRRGGRRE